MRYFFSKKKIILILIVLLILFIFILFIFVYIQQNKNNSYLENEGALNKDVKVVLSEFGHHFNNDQVNEALNKINNKTISKNDRYEATKDLAFYFATAYAASHDPKLRKYSQIIKSYAQQNFPEFYEADEDLFIINCADPTCGEKLDEELTQIQKEITESGISIEDLDLIMKNFEQASYIPLSEGEDKQYGFGLVLSQLASMNNPKASAAADRLREYLKKQYSFEYIKRSNAD